jgi:hypothetical protein
MKNLKFSNLKYYKFFILILVFSVNISSSSIQLEFTETFEVSHDATVDSNNPDLNFESGYLNVSWEPIDGWGQSSYLGFSVDLPNDIIIISIELILEVFLIPLDGHNVSINVWETSSFNEDTITTFNAPALIEIVGTATITEDRIWSLSLNKNQLGVKNSYYFAIENHFADESGWGGYDDTLAFYSKDNSFGDPPKLKITYEITGNASTNNSFNFSGLISEVIVLGIVVGGGSGLGMLFAIILRRYK